MLSGSRADFGGAQGDSEDELLAAPGETAGGSFGIRRLVVVARLAICRMRMLQVGCCGLGYRFIAPAALPVAQRLLGSAIGPRAAPSAAEFPALCRVPPAGA
jgi:hypothetical protein